MPQGTFLPPIGRIVNETHTPHLVPARQVLERVKGPDLVAFVRRVGEAMGKVEYLHDKGPFRPRGTTGWKAGPTAGRSPVSHPSGKPIPPGADCLQKLSSFDAAIVNLCDLSPGEAGRIAYIRPKNHDRLHRLTGFGIVPGVTVTLHQTYPAFCIKFEETELAIERDVAEDIFVSRIGSRE